jgi:prefoldin beta subunit
MSDEISRLPPKVQERLLRLQQLQQTLQVVLTQKQQLELELTEVDQALSELEKLEDATVIYKERKELLNTRITVLGKQEERLRNQVKNLQVKLQQDLRPMSP